MRIGQGFDVHAFGVGNHVMLAGVQVPHSHGVVAHSDGDVVIHALCDAIFGALALGDIGRHFPSTDASWRNADSRRFLRHAALLTAKHGYALGNADITVISEAPRIGPYLRVMRENLAADLGSQVARISIKATTTDKLGFSGRGEGIAAMACVLLDHY